MFLLILFLTLISIYLFFWWKCYSLEYNAIALNENKNNKPRT